jgi:predicted RNA-binding Zn-ribbon protein involved in translation (DUF1610 family)
MLCLNCGREIPFVGKVCPWCGEDKALSNRYLALGVFWAFIMAFIGAGIGLITSGAVGVIIGGFIGAVVGSIIGCIKGLSPDTSGTGTIVVCPNCGSSLTASTKGPSYVCPHCTRMFRA